MSAPSAAIGTTRRPPSASWPSSVGGGAGAVAWTAIASKGARSGTPRLPSPTSSSTLRDAERVEGAARLGGERLVALDADHLGGEAGEHRGRVARAGADLQHPLVAAQLQRLADRGDDPGLGDRLRLADRQGRVGVGAAAEALGDELLARHLPHRRQHALVADPAAAQLPLDHLRAQAVEVRPSQKM